MLIKSGGACENSLKFYIKSWLETHLETVIYHFWQTQPGQLFSRLFIFWRFQPGCLVFRLFIKKTCSVTLFLGSVL